MNTLSPKYPQFSKISMAWKSIAVKEEVYNLIKERAKKELRGISNYLEHELTRERTDNQQVIKLNPNNDTENLLKKLHDELREIEKDIELTMPGFKQRIIQRAVTRDSFRFISETLVYQ